MPLADILQAMEQQVEAEIARLEAQSGAGAGEIRRAAEAEAHAIRERHHREVLAPLQQERARRLNRARLAALRATSRARENLYQQALGCARDRLMALRADAAYGTILGALLREALGQIDGPAVVHADARDLPALVALGPRFPHAQFEFDLDTCGGIAAETPDGCIRVVNTLEARLAQAQEILRQQVMPLFDSAPSNQLREVERTRTVE